MSVVESEELYYAVGGKCFLCDHEFIESEEPWYIFNKQIRADGHLALCIATLLSKILQLEITEETAHSTFLCEICNAKLLEYESLERRLHELQERIKNDYEQTINKLTHKNIEFKVFEEQNKFIAIDEQSQILQYSEFIKEESVASNDSNIVIVDTLEIDEAEPSLLYNNIENTIAFSTLNAGLGNENDSSNMQEITIKSEVNADAVKSADETEEEEEESMPVCADFSDLFVQTDDHFRCQCCQSDEFRNIQHLVRHLRGKHQHQVYCCDLCYKMFVSKKDVNLHLEKEHANSDEFAAYECEACALNFANISQFLLHRRLKHNNYKRHECEICKKLFGSPTLLEEHMNTHTGVRPYKCLKCGKDFAAKYTLQVHAKIHTERKRPYQCEKCGKTFLNQQNLLQHKKVHAGVKPFNCSICNKSFKSQHNLDVHKIVHTGLRPFSCRICGKSFARRAEIKDHERTHTGERPFQCDLCPLAFAQRSNLSSHKKSTHLNQKKHKCQQCDRAFKRRRLLDYHMQAVHTGERPHKCHICGVGFVYPEHYKKHLRIHSGLKPYACEVCGKQFKSRDNRNAHRFVHSDKKPYECLQCGAGFMRKPQLLQHMNNTGHTADAIIVNQPQISITAELEESQQTPAEVEQAAEIMILDAGAEYEQILQPTEELEVITDDNKISSIIVDEKFVRENMYLQFEDFERNAEQTYNWEDLGDKQS